MVDGTKLRASAGVSETDPEARIMKQADGGFAPSYNVQISSDTAAGQFERRGVDPAFRPEASGYHPNSDTYTCPAGQLLGYAGKGKRAGVTHYRYRAAGEVGGVPQRLDQRQDWAAAIQ